MPELNQHLPGTVKLSMPDGPIEDGQVVGTLSLFRPDGNPIDPDLLLEIETPPETGTYTLKAVDGVLTWVEDTP